MELLTQFIQYIFGITQSVADMITSNWLLSLMFVFNIIIR